MSTFLWICVAILILLPCKFDPAIRLKEWVVKKEKHND